MRTLFVSDVHLNSARAGIVKAFLEFLDQKARHADALFILGDLFDEWLGDDDDKAPHPEVCDALAALTASGLPVSVVHGNHDFLLGKRFAARSGCTLLGDHTVIDLYGTPALIMHGDTLCTRDVKYQTFRKVTRNVLLQKLFLSMSLAKRAERAASIRSQSKQDVALKPDDIMDVTAEAVDAMLRRHGVRHLIHGHTHRPAIHDFVLDGERATRIVLGDWYEQDSVLVWDQAGYRLGRIADV
ncbi:MAG: UDP-2,3-diacylglucosamine diphosphatase [Gammaproteobacteria bacterium]|nr:UDP-2,3-diacylglucosamine diphosphatase [Gammaproteobacteria bacterium]NIP87982.1 UDP-2,3-diacylglucosamine diphosphatase [Gammaproteobacteria bacterium]NIR22140.1 UDP-2,3-diacylglucosamine diphosphatase [Gammaproteobacteria bacterium]NIS03822.1 UDP-2,3-diacylglucosamine diphosphatase [Gammaproteobacteria bacterium]NIU42262.1 UDP-2,3-diacylglucosamine diphosphatase [Gammaproteobacteria bacterium]